MLSGVSTSHFVQFYSFIWQFNILIPSWPEQVVPVAVLQLFFFFDAQNVPFLPVGQNVSVCVCFCELVVFENF